MKRRILTAVMIGMIVGTLAGCSGQSNETTKERDMTEQTKQTEQATDSSSEAVLTGAAGEKSEGNAGLGTLDCPEGYPGGDFQIFIKASAGSANDRTMRAYAAELEKILGVTITPNTNSVPQPIIYADLTSEASNGRAYCNILIPNAMNYYSESKAAGCIPLTDYKLVCNLQADAVTVSVRTDDERFKDVRDLKQLFEWFQDHPDQEILMGVNSVGGDGEIALYRLIRYYEKQGVNLDQLVVVNTQGQQDTNASFLGKNTDILFCTVGGIQTLYKDKEVRVLGVLSEERSEFLPDVPSSKELGIEVESALCVGIGMHPDTDDDIVDTCPSALGRLQQIKSFRI
ncbi:tripartite tricarboxylate transporter substrate-binding protein [Clostridium sp. AM58-1XD]|uniref:tripartite tricarboxylate transporter substrate-binding protein n=1 Tax=Clostridium sp. AM58-1XD TaxID=2292307 RepID=UPI000E53C97A|nr:tripartite tricarboxylate transporter substrate-binding protein [Clostridium sp. AM58-1XD]RGZ00603.1 hypothetical protein DXA13_03925 [Clostridium sp. AM58-1XD]